MSRLVLGSASAGRLGVLRHAGVEPLVVVSDVDEDAIIDRLGTASPAAVVDALAAAKASRVVELLDAGSAADCVVIGCDSMLEIDGRLCGKPGSVDAARRQWQSMAGSTGSLHTGHCTLRVQDGVITGQAGETGSTAVYFGTPGVDDLTAYLSSGEPLQVAGGFTLDGLGGWFIDRIEGDPSNVIGLSLPVLRSLLAQLEISVASVWDSNPIGD